MLGCRAPRAISAVALLVSSPFSIGATGLTTNLEQRLLAAHNRERGELGVPHLAWDQSLARSAGRWAEQLGRQGEFGHAPAAERDGGSQGENLWAGTRASFTPEAMVNGWIEEKRYFKPGPFPNNSKTGQVTDVGHYTQLVWSRSTRVGCAVAQSRVEDILVCRYSAAGNVHGQEPM
jgi:hypothetical protein